MCGWRGENVFKKSDFAFSNNAYLFGKFSGKFFEMRKGTKVFVLSACTYVCLYA